MLPVYTPSSITGKCENAISIKILHLRDSVHHVYRLELVVDVFLNLCHNK
jgi:hypothetical protein